MEINTSFKLAPTPPSQNTSKATANDVKGTGQEQVQLSGAAQLKGTEPPINVSRVEEIKRAIAEGRFKTNPEAIADRLITLSQELISTQHNKG